jgi:hypothetical protein
MRRREKFVIATIFLSLALFAIQYISLEWRYLAIAGLVSLVYAVSSWVLSDDLQFHERLTIVPLPAMYAGAVALFYFLLPGNLLSQLTIIILFAIGLYALYLTGNIYSVAKARTIQLLYAAHAVGLFFTLFTSLLLTNTVFSLNLPFWGNGLLVAAIQFPLVFMSLWSVNLEDFIAVDLIYYSFLVMVFLAEFAMLISFLPLPVWTASLFISGLMYLIIGLLQALLRGRLFKNTLREYTLAAIFLGILFLISFPLK